MDDADRGGACHQQEQWAKVHEHGSYLLSHQIDPTWALQFLEDRRRVTVGVKSPDRTAVLGQLFDLEIAELNTAWKVVRLQGEVAGGLPAARIRVHRRAVQADVE